MKWLKNLKEKLAKTSSKVSTGITQIFTHKALDQNALDELEELLITTDMGMPMITEIIEELANEKFNKQVTTEEIKEFLSEKIFTVLKPVSQPLNIEKTENSPHVVLVCGVNGNGKTTTIGKLALRYKNEGKKVMIAACDTFRAAAIDQLRIWSQRAECAFAEAKSDEDPASVAYKAFEQAKKEKCDLLLIDTAGRLHNKTNLMEELAKIIRVIKKLDPNAPHNTILVLDATTGQNALLQVETFKSLINITGLIITKLDGTAKGGILVAIAKKYELPIHAIGVGEGVNDLGEFDPEEFAKALVL